MAGAEIFALGAVVVPATDSLLQAHGYNVKTLGERALGFVVEAGKRRSLVSFPELNISLWLSPNEMADLVAEAASGRADFQAILPSFDDYQKLSLVWIAHRLVQDLKAQYVLAVESGDLVEIFDQEDHPLDHYFKGDINTPAFCLSLGVSELSFEIWADLRSRLGDRLLFSRVLPSGMHKFEIAIYLRR
jgi:hypothetical protein